ncbi:MAG: hypothetical protein D6704_08805 [Nitrospirae bacterium]|nr:MAG: hypothetical protein D6704_08805 [Nitrospirota bacterium]
MLQGFVLYGDGHTHRGRHTHGGRPMNEELRQLMSEIGRHMTQFHQLLERRAQELELLGGDPDVVKKLMTGADAMRDSANIYLSWARHYVTLSERGLTTESEEDEESWDDIGL